MKRIGIEPINRSHRVTASRNEPIVAYASSFLFLFAQSLQLPVTGYLRLLCWQFPWPSSPAFYQIAFPFCKSPSLTTVGLEPTICDRNLFCQTEACIRRPRTPEGIRTPMYPLTFQAVRSGRVYWCFAPKGLFNCISQAPWCRARGVRPLPDKWSALSPRRSGNQQTHHLT